MKVAVKNCMKYLEGNVHYHFRLRKFWNRITDSKQKNESVPILKKQDFIIKISSYVYTNMRISKMQKSSKSSTLLLLQNLDRFILTETIRYIPFFTNLNASVSESRVVPQRCCFDSNWRNSLNSIVWYTGSSETSWTILSNSSSAMHQKIKG